MSECVRERERDYSFTMCEVDDPLGIVQATKI